MSILSRWLNSILIERVVLKSEYLDFCKRIKIANEMCREVGYILNVSEIISCGLDWVLKISR